MIYPNYEEFLNRASQVHHLNHNMETHWSDFEIRLITETYILARHRKTQHEYVITHSTVIDVGGEKSA